MKVFHDFKSKQTNQDEYGSLRTKEIVIRKYKVHFLYNQLKPEGFIVLSFTNCAVAEEKNHLQLRFAFSYSSDKCILCFERVSTLKSEVQTPKRNGNLWCLASGKM